MKTCSKCKTEKTAEEFSRNRSRKDGLAHRCKSCVVNYHKVYRQKQRRKYKTNCSGCDKERTFPSKSVYLKYKDTLCKSCSQLQDPDGTIRQRSDKAKHGEWAAEIRKRDKRCQWEDYGPCVYPLHAHHIMSASDFPELRYERR